MRSAPGGFQLQTQHAAGGKAQPAVGGLAVHEKARSCGGQIGRPRAVTATLLAHHKQQTDALFAVATQLIGRANLRGENALRVTGPAAVDSTTFDSAGEKRRDAIEM